MVNEIRKINYELSKTDFKGTSQYGIQATLPTGKGLVSKALESEVIRRNDKSERMIDFANKVVFINDRRDRITDEKEKIVLDCLLDGLSLTATSKHMGISRSMVTDIRDNIVDKLAK